MRLITQLCLTGIAGLSSHLGFFIHSEHHLYAPQIFRFYLLLTALIFCTVSFSQGGNLADAGMTTFFLLSSYNAALFCSMFVYRVFFHRLRGYPGPFMAKVTKLWNVVRASKSTNFRLMEDMRCRYGDFVRTGTSWTQFLVLDCSKM